MTERVDCVVVGAGVVGLAVARALALAGREVLVLEAEDSFGTHTSSRNSEVVHSGIYYAPGSLKARLCVRGRQMLAHYCTQRGLGYQAVGKLVVATDAGQLDDLRAILERGRANGVPQLQWLNAAQAQALEPELCCEAALLSPVTGIVDSHALMLSLLGDLEQAGGLLVTRTRVAALKQPGDGSCNGLLVLAEGDDGTMALRARSVVNAAGLHAPRLAAHTEGMPPHCVPRAWYAKGSYFDLRGKAPFGRLIYPVPEPGGLGVHLTLDLAGRARFGPNVRWVASPDDLDVDPADGSAFQSAVRRYWPGLPEDALQPAYAGVRPKISGPGAPVADFLVQGPAQHGLPGLVNLFGIESPGLTSCLAIAAHVGALLDDF